MTGSSQSNKQINKISSQNLSNAGNINNRGV